MHIDIENAASPGLMRRLAAIFYDSWLIVGIWLVGAIVDTYVRDPSGLDLAISRLPLQLFFVAVPFVFFGWFWTHGGRTLGMQAWRLKLLQADGSPVTWRASVTRVAAAHLSLFALGMGYLWILFDRDSLAWHDRLSNTRLIIIDKS